MIQIRNIICVFFSAICVNSVAQSNGLDSYESKDVDTKFDYIYTEELRDTMWFNCVDVEVRCHFQGLVQVFIGDSVLFQKMFAGSQDSLDTASFQIPMSPFARVSIVKPSTEERFIIVLGGSYKNLLLTFPELPMAKWELYFSNHYSIH